MSVPPSPYGHPGSPPPRPEVPEGVPTAWLPPQATPPSPPPGPPSPADERASLPPFAPWAPFAALVIAYALAIFSAFILAGVVEVFGRDVDPNHLPTGVVLGATMVQDVLLIVLAVVFARVSEVIPSPSAFGLRRIRLGPGIAWALATFVCFYVFTAVWTIALGVQEKDDLAQELGAQDSALNLIAVTLLVAIIAPIAEEVFFRGFLFPAIWRWRGWITGAVVTGVIFGLVHAGGTPVVFLVPLAVLGFLLCALYRWTGSLLPGMGVHAFNNSLALGVTLHWDVAYVLLAIVLGPAIVVTIGARLADWRALPAPA
jgi:membrane protease YdiL (CAAX protease family)